MPPSSLDDEICDECDCHPDACDCDPFECAAEQAEARYEGMREALD